MTREQQQQIFLLQSRIVDDVANIAGAVGMMRSGAIADGDVGRSDDFADVIDALRRGEFQRAMDAADAAGFATLAFPSLLDARRKLDDLVSQIQQGVIIDDDTIEIKLSAVAGGSF